MCNQYDFSDIAPFDDTVFRSKMSCLVSEPGFEHAVRFAMPGVDYASFAEKLKSIPDKATFQHEIMVPFLKDLERTTTDGLTCGGTENMTAGHSYTIMSNHRDIVLDASFLNLCLHERGITTSEIAIGSNLLIFDWITELVKLNKSFIVKRNIERKKALDAARQLSAYIHYAINCKHENVWIAQREGRAKDSDDQTQESLIKMLALEGNGQTAAENLLSLNIMPLSISYEYDPNDYLKAREFLLRRLDPEFKKSPHDDLLSMETGLLHPKGRIHFQLAPCINPAIEILPPDTPKADLVKAVCHAIDSSIHRGYQIYPVNYYAYDQLHGQTEFADRYSSSQADQIEMYFRTQLDKVDIPGLSDPDRQFMRRMMLSMYANPLRNKLAATR